MRAYDEQNEIVRKIPKMRLESIRLDGRAYRFYKAQARDRPAVKCALPSLARTDQGTVLVRLVDLHQAGGYSR